MVKKIFRHTVVAGTFDRLHHGHQHLLKRAFQQSQQLSCGLTTQVFVKQSQKKLKPLIQSYSQRLRQLKTQLPNTTPVFPLNNPHGPALESLAFDSIVVTKDTLTTANLINQRRQQNKLKPLALILIDLVPAQDSSRLSSTRIRLGQLSRNGLPYCQLLPQKTIFLPTDQRHYFKQPFGQLIPASTQSLDWATLQVKQSLAKLKASLIITVGDLTTQAFTRHHIPFNLALFDYKIQRQAIPQKRPLANCPFVSVKNPAGCLHVSLIGQLKKILSDPLKLTTSLVQVDGEEDLAVIPLVLLAPLNTLIFYGQPNQGLVRLKVTEKTKKQAVRLLNKFSY